MPVSPEDLSPVFALRSIMQKKKKKKIMSSKYFLLFGVKLYKTIFPEAPWYLGNNLRRFGIF